jgi:DNA modification methylase
MEIKRMKLRDLTPADYHPRKEQKPGDDNFEDIRKSIEEFGHVQPIVWNVQTGNIVGGHQRRTVLLSMGIEEDDVSVVDLPPSKEKLLNIALNKIGSDPKLWDLPRLKDLIIEFEELNLDVELTGFDKIEIEKLLSRDIVEDNYDGDAEYDKIITPVTQLGDIYQLGRHRLMCGDSTSVTAIATLMAGHKADMVFTDPPYNVNYGATMKDQIRGRASKENAGRKILNDNFKTTDEFYQFLRAAIAAFQPFVFGDVYICMSSSELHTLQSAFADCGGHFSTFIIWVKNQFTIGRANYQRQYEPILYGWFEGSSHYWSGVRNLGDVYGVQDLKRDDDGMPLVRVESCGIESDIWEFNKPTISKEHPTMKPIGLVARSLRNSSKPGALVLDSFGGSGTTMMASEQTGRICYMMELDPKYCDVEVKRWELFTGNKAELINGRI